MNTSIMSHQFLSSCFFCNILFFALFFHNDCLSKDYTLADISRVENIAIANREKIRMWHLRLSLKNEIFMKGSDFDPEKYDKRGRLVDMDVYKDDDVFRVDRFFVQNDEKYRYVTILGKEWFYLHCDEKIDSGVLVTQLTSRKLLSTISGYYDARMLGFDPNDIRTLPENLTSFIGNPRRKNLRMVDEKIDDELSYKIMFSFLWNEDNDCSIWIAPGKGYNPLRFELTLNEKQTSILDIDVKKNQDSGLWFPASMSTKTLKGNEILYQGTTIVDVISLNKKLDPNLFNEKGLNLPIGTLVMMDPEPFPDTFTWDGEKIVSLSGAALSPVVSHRGNVIRYLLIAAGLVMLSTGCLMKYFELTKKNRKPSDD